MVTAKRRCLVAGEVLSRCGKKKPRSASVVAGDDVALDPRRVELEGAVNHRDQAAVQPVLDPVLQRLLGDHAVGPALARAVEDADRAPVARRHVPRREAALLVVVVDQAAAEGRLEHPRQDQRRGDPRRPAVLLDPRQAFQCVQQRALVPRHVGQRHPGHDAQRRVEDDGLGMDVGRVVAAGGQEQARHLAVGVVEPADARDLLHQAILGEVGRVAGDAEEGEVEVVEAVAVARHEIQHGLALRAARAAEQADEGETPCDGVEIEPRIGMRRRGEPRRRVAGPQPAFGNGSGAHGVFPHKDGRTPPSKTRPARAARPPPT
jgi:hypothetical protein